MKLVEHRNGNVKEEFNGKYSACILVVTIRIILFCIVLLGIYLRRNVPVRNSVVDKTMQSF
jgi:hypothetical protein